MSKTIDNIKVGDRFREDHRYVWEIIDTSPARMRIVGETQHDVVDEYGVYKFEVSPRWIVTWTYLGNYAIRGRRVPIQTTYGSI